ncbi:hypothetical protein H8958_000418 [Nasalis larvatus]
MSQDVSPGQSQKKRMRSTEELKAPVCWESGGKELPIASGKEESVQGREPDQSTIRVLHLAPLTFCFTETVWVSPPAPRAVQEIFVEIVDPRARDAGCAQGSVHTEAPPEGPGVRLGSALRGVSSVPGRHRPERRAAGAPEPRRPQRAGGSQHGARAGGALLEGLLRAVFGRQAGGPVQAAAYCPGLPASCLAVQAAACRALQAAGAGQPVEGAWERPGLPGLLACFSWGPWSRRKDQDVAACRSPAHENFQEPEEELALTAIFPNGDCEDLGRGSKACDGVVHTPAEPTGDSR